MNLRDNIVNQFPHLCESLSLRQSGYGSNTWLAGLCLYGGGPPALICGYTTVASNVTTCATIAPFIRQWRRSLPSLNVAPPAPSTESSTSEQEAPRLNTPTAIAVSALCAIATMRAMDDSQTSAQEEAFFHTYFAVPSRVKPCRAKPCHFLPAIPCLLRVSVARVASLFFPPNTPPHTAAPSAHRVAHRPPARRHCDPRIGLLARHSHARKRTPLQTFSAL